MKFKRNKEVKINPLSEEDLNDMVVESEARKDYDIRQFPSGATRDTDTDKIDYTGILSWEVIERLGFYMQEHSVQKDGTTRSYGNWKLGIPKEEYLKSLMRHVLDLWAKHESDHIDVIGVHTADKDIEDAACAVLFNIQGYLYEFLKEKNG